MDEKELSSITKDIKKHLKNGTLKMGELVHIAYAGGLRPDKGDSPAPIYDMLTVTPDYKKELRKYFIRITKEVDDS